MATGFFLTSMGWLDRIGTAPDRIRDVRDSVVLAWMTRFIVRLASERLNGNPLHRRTGNLANQWTPMVVAYQNSTKFSVKSMAGLDEQGRGYSLAHEYGATITPKSSKYLWIPLDGNKTEAGVARISPTQAIEAGGFFANGVFFGRALTKSNVPQRSQHLGGAGYKGATFKRGENITPLFALKKSVTIPARMGANAMWQEEAGNLHSQMRTALIGAIRG